MSSKAFERMRLRSHAQIRREMEYHEQLLQTVSPRINKRKTCRYNANSAFLLCAVNPNGSCTDCRDYEPLEQN